MFPTTGGKPEMLAAASMLTFGYLCFGGCASLPEYHRMERARTEFVVADPGSVQRAYWQTLDKLKIKNPVDDYGFPIMRGKPIPGWSMLQPDGWCQVWISWNSSYSTVLHELQHCEGTPRLVVADRF